MFCKNCGTRNVDGAKFCMKCGTPIEQIIVDNKEEAEALKVEEAKTEAEAPKVEEAKTEAEAPKVEEAKTEAEAPKVEEAKTEAEALETEEAKEATQKEDVKREIVPGETQLLMPLEEEEPFVAQTPSQKKSSGTKMKPAMVVGIVLIAIVVLIVVAVVGITVVGPMFSGRDDQMIYMEDEDIYYLKDMTKPEKAIKIDNTKDMSVLVGANFSEDGKYLYFYNEYDDGEYTLNRVKLSKLKANRTNDKYIEEIASDVRSYEVTDSGVLYYLNKDDDLIEYKKGKERELERDVIQYAFSDNNSKIYCRISDGEQQELCVISLSDGKSEIIDDKIDGFETFCKGEDFFVYYKNTNDSKIDIYTVKGTELPVCAAEDADAILGVDTKTGTIYYEEEQEEEKTLYDFVNDTAAQEDEGITEPTVRDCLKEVKEKKALNACLSKSEDKKYRTGKDKDLQKYYNQLQYDDESDLYFDYAEDYSKTYYYDENAKQWYVYDVTIYETKYEAYEKVADRIELRENLKETPFSVSTTTVYKVVTGEAPKEICSGVLMPTVNVKNDMVVYYKFGENFVKKDIKEISYASDVENYMLENYIEMCNTYYCIGDGEESVFDIDGFASVFDTTEKGKVILCQGVHLFDDDFEDRDYLSQQECRIFYCEIEGDKITKTEEVTDEAYGGTVIVWADGAFYYTAEAQDDDGMTLVNLYKYENGQSEKVLEEVSVRIAVTDDGNYIDSYDDLVIYNAKGENEKITRDVGRYSYLKKNRIVYISDEDLYVYNGKEEIRITREVQDYLIYIEQQGEDVDENVVCN